MAEKTETAAESVRSVALRFRRVAARIRDATYYWLILNHPATAFQILGVVGRLTDRRSWANHCVAPDEIAALFEAIPPRRRARIVSQIRALHLRGLALHEIVQRANFERLIPLVQLRGFDRLQDLQARKQPAILLAWHVGAEFAVMSALYRAGVEALIVGADMGFKLRPGFTLCETSGNAVLRGFTLKQAVDHLRSGGLVLIAADGRPGDSAIKVTCMGRHVTFRRGPAILARLSGAPVMPIVGRWAPNGRTIEVTVYDSLPAPNVPPEAVIPFEHALMTEVGRWIEGYLHSAPEELHADRLRDWLNAPRAPSIGESGEGARSVHARASGTTWHSPRFTIPGS